MCGSRDRLHCLRWVLTGNIGWSFVLGESNAACSGPGLLIGPIRLPPPMKCQLYFRARLALDLDGIEVAV